MEQTDLESGHVAGNYEDNGLAGVLIRIENGAVQVEARSPASQFTATRIEQTLRPLLLSTGIHEEFSQALLRNSVTLTLVSPRMSNSDVEQAALRQSERLAVLGSILDSVVTGKYSDAIAIAKAHGVCAVVGPYFDLIFHSYDK